MTYRLGLDVGTNSIGWCVLDLDANGAPTGIRDMGVRIFPDSRDPKSGTSLAAERRLARSMRRRRDRYIGRRNGLMAALVRHALMPADPAARKALEGLDPYALRARGLDEALPPHEFGRALFHLNQRRGFKSNRRTDTDDKETGVVKGGISELGRRLRESGARTLGEYLHRRRTKGKPVRARPGTGIYPSRAMLEAEFDTLWAAQAPHHPHLTDAARDDIRDILFHQRPLKPVEPGNCEFEPGDKRAPLALPLTQRFRMYQELANLRVLRPGQAARPLTMEQRDTLVARLSRQKTMTFNAMRKPLGLDAEATFNLEDTKRKALNGDQTGTVLAAEDLFGARWWDMDDDARDSIVETLLEAEDEDALARHARDHWGLDAEAAAKLSNVRLVQGYGRLGRRAMSGVVAALIDERAVDPETGEILDQPVTYAAAAQLAGYHHSDRRPDDLLPALPYYGEILSRYTAGDSGDPDDRDEARFGKLANPTVHVGLNQLRRITNALIARHGTPDGIVVELARELKMSQQRKTEVQKEQAANQRRNELIADAIRTLGHEVTGENIRRYKLWEELGDVHDRRCVYTGRIISGAMLFTAEVEIEHILPFGRTLDNSMANRTLSLRKANRDKGDRSPFEAFGHNPAGYDYDGIARRGGDLPRNKRWRFQPDAMDRFEGENDFIARQLTDTAYLARVTREYLTHVCPANQVYVVPGRLTALLRGKWGLNSLLSDANLKERTDHRHHAIDALVAAVTDRGLLNRVARTAEETRGRLIADMPDPWPGFRDAARDSLNDVIVSHKPDHGKGGQLHEATAYGIVADPEQWDGCNLTFRKALVGLTAGEMARIRDKALREALLTHVAAEDAAGKKLKQAQESFRWPAGTDRRVRRVRLLKKKKKIIPISGNGGKPYKALIPGDNHHVDIYELPDGKWAGEGVSVFDANQGNFIPAWRREYPGARLVMRLHKGDLIKVETREHTEQVMLVHSTWQTVLQLAGHCDAGDLKKRHKLDSEIDPFRWFWTSFSKLKERGTRKVTVDALGRVHDPGPPS